MRRMLVVLVARPGFRRLWLGELVSLVGDWLSYVAVSVLALRSGQGALALAAVFAAHALPTALVSPFAGWLADRFDRRRLLVSTQIAQAALTAVMLVAAHHQALVLLQLALFARNALAGVMHPAKQAALPRLVAREELVDANAVDAATWSVAFTLGTALGGVVTLAGPLVALGVDMLTFVAAGWLFAGLPALPAPAEARAARPVGAIGAAWRHALERPGLLEAVASKTPLALAAGAAWVLLNLAAENLAGTAAAGLAVGLLQAVRGAGTGVGPLVARHLAARGRSPTWLLRASVFLGLGAIALLSQASGWTALFVSAGLWGLGGGGSWVMSSSQIQRLAHAALVGRASALDQLGFTSAMSASALAIGLAVDAGIRPGTAVMAAAALGALAYASLVATSSNHAGADPQVRRSDFYGRRAQ